MAIFESCSGIVGIPDVPTRLARRGRSAHASPARTPVTSFFDEARQRYAGEAVFIDIPDGNAPAAAAADAMGLTPGRLPHPHGPRSAGSEDLTRLWASAGPEKG